MAAGTITTEETAEERAAREEREDADYRKRLRAAADQAARHVAFTIRRGCIADIQERHDAAADVYRPFPVLLVEGCETGIDMLDDRTVDTAAGPKAPRRPTIKRIGELLRLARLAASVAK